MNWQKWAGNETCGAYPQDSVWEVREWRTRLHFDQERRVFQGRAVKCTCVSDRTERSYFSFVSVQGWGWQGGGGVCFLSSLQNRQNTSRERGPIRQQANFRMKTPPSSITKRAIRIARQRRVSRKGIRLTATGASDGQRWARQWFLKSLRLEWERVMQGLNG